MTAVFAQLQSLVGEQAAPIDPMRLAAIGFCFGGTSMPDLARTGADAAAVVSFQDGLGTDDAVPAQGGAGGGRRQ